jgi:hypothetical protein
MAAPHDLGGTPEVEFVHGKLLNRVFESHLIRPNPDGRLYRLDRKAVAEGFLEKARQFRV